jgi:hypothetical protein
LRLLSETKNKNILFLAVEMADSVSQSASNPQSDSIIIRKKLTKRGRRQEKDKAFRVREAQKRADQAKTDAERELVCPSNLRKRTALVHAQIKQDLDGFYARLWQHIRNVFPNLQDEMMPLCDLPTDDRACHFRLDIEAFLRQFSPKHLISVSEDGFPYVSVWVIVSAIFGKDVYFKDHDVLNSFYAVIFSHQVMKEDVTLFTDDSKTPMHPNDLRRFSYARSCYPDEYCMHVLPKLICLCAKHFQYFNSVKREIDCSKK